MNYHYRFGEDGTCKVICTRCFATIGIVNGLEEVKRLERVHRCSAETHNRGHHVVSRRDQRQTLPRGSYPKVVLSFPLYYLLPASFLLLYALPTICEFVLFRNPHLRYPCILFGNFVGCGSLFFIFHLRKTAISLYLLLTGFASYLLAARTVPGIDIPWALDLIPSVI